MAERSHETGHCLELFRRALDEQDEAAWHFVQTQYRQLLISWFSQFAGRPLGQTELDDLVQNTFIRLWRTPDARPQTIRRQVCPHRRGFALPAPLCGLHPPSSSVS
ncbi:MAG: hypothetical protein H6651_07545 [Ardenticatenales bacterium]|nr:hypothetical protein [Ardenticatenales bacterium]